MAPPRNLASDPILSMRVVLTAAYPSHRPMRALAVRFDTYSNESDRGVKLESQSPLPQVDWIW